MKSIVVTGSFDDIRSRQIRFLQEASQLGKVHVHLWSDEVVRNLTGKAPRLTAAERHYFIQAIRYVDHVSLVTGDINPDQIPQTARMLGRVVTAYDAPLVQYRGLGLFRNIREPRVLWIGLDIDPVIRKMKAELDRELKQLGFRIDRKDFRPHLTLARIKWMQNKDALRELLHAYKDYFFQESTIRNLVFYESVLSREGPSYKVIKSVPFKYAVP